MCAALILTVCCSVDPNHALPFGTPMFFGFFLTAFSPFTTFFNIKLQTDGEDNTHVTRTTTLMPVAHFLHRVECANSTLHSSQCERTLYNSCTDVL